MERSGRIREGGRRDNKFCVHSSNTDDIMGPGRKGNEWERQREKEKERGGGREGEQEPERTQG